MTQRNQLLTQAKRQKKDEFYTQFADVERECVHYVDQFRDKIVYCNCDVPGDSAFWQYFHENFAKLGLKQLVSTYQNPYGLSCLTVYGGGSDMDVLSGERRVLLDGDFRSPVCQTVLLACDIVVTNPPFSLFQEFVRMLVDAGKQFLIMGHTGAIACKDFFPLLMYDTVSVGYLFNQTCCFRMPDDYVLSGKGYTDASGQKYGYVSGICFFTNLQVDRQSEPLILTESYAAHPEWYPHYDNYDAIEVSRVSLIPYDYDGVMGVPVTFLAHYCPAQFQLLGETSGRCDFGQESWPVKRYVNPLQYQFSTGEFVPGGKANTGAQYVVPDSYEGTYYVAENAKGKLKRVYRRLLIRRK